MATTTYRVFYLTRQGNARIAIVQAHDAEEAVAIVCGINVRRYGRVNYRPSEMVEEG